MMKEIDLEKEFIPYEEALALKELGFDEPCFGYYISPKSKVSLEIPNGRNGEHILFAPLHQQAFRWFEDNYDNAVTIKTYKMSNGVRWYDYSVNEFGGRSKSKEEAELACLRKLIEIVKSN